MHHTDFQLNFSNHLNHFEIDVIQRNGNIPRKKKINFFPQNLAELKKKRIPIAINDKSDIREKETEVGDGRNVRGDLANFP